MTTITCAVTGQEIGLNSTIRTEDCYDIDAQLYRKACKYYRQGCLMLKQVRDFDALRKTVEIHASNISKYILRGNDVQGLFNILPNPEEAPRISDYKGKFKELYYVMDVENHIMVEILSKARNTAELDDYIMLCDMFYNQRELKTEGAVNRHNGHVESDMLSCYLEGTILKERL